VDRTPTLDNRRVPSGTACSFIANIPRRFHVSPSDVLGLVKTATREGQEFQKIPALFRTPGAFSANRLDNRAKLVARWEFKMSSVWPALLELCRRVAINQSLVDRDLENAPDSVHGVVVPSGE